MRCEICGLEFKRKKYEAHLKKHHPQYSPIYDVITFEIIGVEKKNNYKKGK